ncbi:MAG: hypothetical protein BroJett039_07020 [Chloroflexota bacterium]|nr:MAG: hypothetical protein BroJett039_07020 [Chloroflexota bacterium]
MFNRIQNTIKPRQDNVLCKSIRHRQVVKIRTFDEIHDNVPNSREGLAEKVKTMGQILVVKFGKNLTFDSKLTFIAPRIFLDGD